MKEAKITRVPVSLKLGISVDSAEAAASALAPFAGHYAKVLFAAGLTAASFLAACVLPLTTSYVLCEAFGWGSTQAARKLAAVRPAAKSTFA